MRKTDKTKGGYSTFCPTTGRIASSSPLTPTEIKSLEIQRLLSTKPKLPKKK